MWECVLVFILAGAPLTGWGPGSTMGKELGRHSSPPTPPPRESPGCLPTRFGFCFVFSFCFIFYPLHLHYFGVFSFLCIPQIRFLASQPLAGHASQNVYERPAKGQGKPCLLRLSTESSYRNPGSARLSNLPRVTQHVKRQYLHSQTCSS